MRFASGSPEGASLRIRALAAVTASVLAGCVNPLPAVGLRFPSSSRITEEELRFEVQEASSRFQAAITRTADAIEAEATDPLIRRRALLWKIRMTPLVQRAGLAQRCVEGLLELMALSAAQEEYLARGSGANLFGDQQDLARQTAREIEVDLAELPARLLDQDEAQVLGADVERFARRHPIDGEFVIATPQSVRADLERFKSFQRVLSVPLAPFRALEGVESGAGSIREFNVTARHFNEVLSGLPQQARWQLQLLLYDLDTRGTVQRGLSSAERMAESSERFSIAVEGMPESVRRELVTLLEESARSQGELRNTLAAVQGAIERVDPVLQTFERVGWSVRDAGNAWQGVVQEVNEVRAASPPAAAAGPPAPPFDIEPYERTVRQVRDAAVEIRSAAAEIRAALAALPSGSAWGELVDRLFWRCAALIGIVFALRLVYRVLVQRLQPRSGQ
jgi:hypothetical protein